MTLEDGVVGDLSPHVRETDRRETRLRHRLTYCLSARGCREPAKESVPREGRVTVNRRVVVSGGGTGLGRAIARAFAHDGDDVVIIGRRLDALERTTQELNAETGRDRVTFRSADLSDPEQTGATADAIAGGGSVDVLVNNAGGNASGGTDTLGAVADGWLADFRANVLTAVLLTEALLPHLTRPGGRIIAMSSVAAVRGAGSYGASKAALHAWIFGLAASLGPEGITVNAVAPGFVPDTEFWDGRRTPEVAEPRIATTLVKRAGTPEEVAQAVSYLASPLAGFTTGQILQVNGGSVLGRG